MKSFFDIAKSGSSIRIEILAGFTTFFTMAYIIFVNPMILSMPFYIQESPDADLMKNSIFVATCLSAAIGTLLMSLYARLPFAQAPGMGLNAFFAFTIVLGMGYTFNQALAAVFISGIVFIIINMMGIRRQIVESIPLNIKYAITVGIGIFIALIGFINAGIIVGNEITLVEMVDFSKYQTEPKVKTALVALIGLFLTVGLMVYKVRGAIFIGIILTTILGIPFNVTHLPESFRIINMPPSIEPTLFKMDFIGLLNAEGSSLAGVIFYCFNIIGCIYTCRFV